MIIRLKNILNDRIFIIILGIAVGLIFGSKVAFLKPYTIYIIGIVLAFSISGFSFNQFKMTGANLKRINTALLLNYVLFNVFLLLGGKFMFSHDVFMGMVVVAATPPAVAIIPISISIGANNKLSLIGVLGGNFAALIISPLLIYLFVDNNIPLTEIIIMITQIIVIPTIFSRLLRHKKVYPSVAKSRSHVIDWGFFLIVTAIIGISRDSLLNNIDVMIYIILFYIALMMIVGSILYFVFRKFKMQSNSAFSSILLFSLKNAGFAAVLSLFLFPENPTANLAAAGMSILIPFYFIYIIFFKKIVLKKELKRKA